MSIDTSGEREIGSAASAASRMRVLELEEQLRGVHSSIVVGLHQLLDLKDLNTGIHSTRLAEWSLRIARELGIEEKLLGEVEAAALLHDIGKVGVPDAILKKGGALSDDERAMMNKHPEFGWAIQRTFPSLEHASLFTLHHHESCDGTGYPGRLRLEETPLGARIISVIDAFDAMISDRPYRDRLPYEEALRRLIAGSGKQFDPAVVRCFVGIAEDEAAAVFAATGASQGAPR